MQAVALTPLAQRQMRPVAASVAAAAARAMSTPAAPVVCAMSADAPFRPELVAATRAVRLASKLCQAVQQQLSSSEKVAKQDESPVTVADYAAQAVVAWALAQSPHAAPGGVLSLVAEEDSASLREPAGAAMLARITDLVNSVLTAHRGPQAAPLSTADLLQLIDLGASQGGPTGRHWVLDPIDGTKGFVGMRQYSVCLGMLQDGVVELGVLGCPNLPQGSIDDESGGAGAMSRAGQQGVGSVFLAHRGHGAFTAPLYADDEQLQALTPVHVEDLAGEQLGSARMMESWESRHSDHSYTAAVARAMGLQQDSLRMDSQVKYGLLSRGAASIFMRFPPPSYKEKIWDHCAGFVIVEEAGGCVTDASGQRLDFSKGRYLPLDRPGHPYGILAAPPQVHAAMLKAVAHVQRERAAAQATLA